MKKLLFLLCLGLCANVNAQYIVDFTEEDLLGTWDVTQVSGDFSSIGFTGDSNTFRSFEFNDGTYSRINYYDDYYGWETEYSFVSFFVTNRQVLHFIRDRKYGENYTGLSLYKLKILHYDGQGNIKLRTLTGNGYVTLQKRNTNSSVRSMSAPDDSAAYYNLKGEKTDEPSHGINIIKKNNGDTKKAIIK